MIQSVIRSYFAESHVSNCLVILKYISKIHNLKIYCLDETFMYLFIESDKKLNLIRVAAPYQSVFQDQLNYPV